MAPRTRPVDQIGPIEIAMEEENEELLPWQFFPIDGVLPGEVIGYHPLQPEEEEMLEIEEIAAAAAEEMEEEMPLEREPEEEEVMEEDRMVYARLMRNGDTDMANVIGNVLTRHVNDNWEWVCPTVITVERMSLAVAMTGGYASEALDKMEENIRNEIEEAFMQSENQAGEEIVLWGMVRETLETKLMESLLRKINERQTEIQMELE